jgi:putative FmdB family regulatory protein
MPRYLYRCSECNEEYQELHSIKEKLTDCKLCDSVDSLVRVPSSFMSKQKNKNLKRKPGSVVKEFIETSKEELKSQKKGLEEKR